MTRPQHHPQSGQAATHAAGRPAVLRATLLRWAGFAPAAFFLATILLPPLPVMSGSDFGQRDGLMAMAAIPHCLLAARRIEGPPVAPGLALGVALAAALGFALKPYVLAVPLQEAYRRCPGGPAPYHDPAAMTSAEFAFYQQTAQGFATLPPLALVVTRHANIAACGDRFDLLEYFQRHPLFAEAFMRYRPAGEIDGHRLFLRQD